MKKSGKVRDFLYSWLLGTLCTEYNCTKNKLQKRRTKVKTTKGGRGNFFKAHLGRGRYPGLFKWVRNSKVRASVA